MNRNDTTYKKIKYIGDNSNAISKIPHYKINFLLKEKQQKQNLITKIKITLTKLEEMKSNEKEQITINHLNEKISYYDELILFYNKKINNICNVLKLNCDHVLVNDSIDISFDKSQPIIYCELCETTF